jgi:hypothetical protein
VETVAGIQKGAHFLTNDDLAEVVILPRHQGSDRGGSGGAALRHHFGHDITGTRT